MPTYAVIGYGRYIIYVSAWQMNDFEFFFSRNDPQEYSCNVWRHVFAIVRKLNKSLILFKTRIPYWKYYSITTINNKNEKVLVNFIELKQRLLYFCIFIHPSQTRVFPQVGHLTSVLNKTSVNMADFKKYFCLWDIIYIISYDGM